MLKFDYPEDYTGTNLNHRIINEKRTLTDATSRVVTLDYGAFFVNEHFVIRNAATSRPIIPGRDYACVELDTVATSKSGKPVFTTIVIQNKQITEIEIDYIFVGGQHMTGLHLIKNLKKVYPNGLNPKYHWDTTLNKPETFKAKEHATHVMELYGLDGVNASIKEMIDALGFKDSRQANLTFANIVKKLGEMNVQLDEFIVETEARVNQAFEDFRVQDNEFIFTNSMENPAIKRGYGNWVLVRNTILKGGNKDNAYVIGNDSVIALGTQQMATNVYVWKNQNNSKAITYTITSVSHAGLSASQRREEQDIVFNIRTTNAAVGSKLAWVLVDNTTNEPVSGHLLHTPITGDVILDSTGQAQVTVKFKANTNTPTANRSYSFRLLKTETTVYTFTVLDSSLEKRIEVNFTIDVGGLYPVKQVEENQEFFLQIKYIGNWARGEVAILDWSASGIPFNRLASGLNPAPTSIVVPSSPTEVYSLRVSANSLIDSKQTLVVYALQGVDETISSVAAHAEVVVIDSSRFNYASVTFNNRSTNVVNVARIDEDVLFAIVIDTNTPNTELNIIYNTTKPIKDFSGLLSTVTTNASGRVVINAATIADFLTNIGAQSITVLVEVAGVTTGYNTLFINDTSKTPNYQAFFSRQSVTDVITEVNEGEKFFLNIKVDGWVVGARAPSLEFNYTLDDDNGTTTPELKARIASTLYSAMLFDSSSATYNEVTWVNGNTLRFEFTAIADKVIKGDTKLTVKVKQSNQNQFDKVANLVIRDTSIPTIVSTWSSSAVTLTPISAVDEMQSSGLNQRCYLWIDVDGDGGSFGNITLTSNSNNGVDFVTLFPNVIRIGAGVSRYIVTVDAKADFIAEGNKTLYVAGSYKNSRNQDVELFRSSITLVDNSVLTALTAAMSTSNSSVVPSSGFSEWVPFYAHLTFPAFAFDSQIEWRIVFTSNPSNGQQLLVEEGLIEVLRNASQNVLTLTPIKDRLKDGESTFTFYYRRKIKATGQYITTEKALAGVKILDDSLPMTVEIKVFSDAARTQPIGATVNEGAKLYLRAIVSNPDRNYSVSFGLQHSSLTSSPVDGFGNVLLLGSTSVPSRLLIDDRKIVTVVPASAGTVTVNVDAEMTVVADRLTSGNLNGMSLEARVYDNSSNAYPVGVVAGFGDAPYTQARQIVVINDTSKTAAYNVVAPSSVNEDTAFRIDVAVADGTIGDVYYPVLLSGINASRFSVSELGVEQLASTVISSHSWIFKVAPDYQTTGNLNLVFGIMNKTTGKQIATKTIVLNDTVREPVLVVTTGLNIDSTWTLQPLLEGTNHVLRVHASNEQLYTGDSIKIEWVSGRAASEFTGMFGDFIVDVNKQVINNVVVRKDRKTNTAAENVVVIKVTSAFSGISKNFTINITDTSQTPAIRTAVWKNNVTNAVITQASEGDRVRLEIQANGGFDPYSLTLTNDGGRSIARLNSHEYGVAKTRDDDTDILSWVFDIKQDYTTNTGIDTMLKVKVVGSVGSISQTYTLPIIDTSKSTAGFIEFHADNSTTPITTVSEGLAFGVRYVITEPDPDATFRLLTTSSRTDDGWKVDSTLPTAQFYHTGGENHTYKFNKETSYNGVTNTAAQLTINAELWDVKNNRLLASNSLTLIDTSRTIVPSASIRITTQGGTAHASSLNEGITADVYVLASAFAGVDWTKETIRLDLSSTYSVGGSFTVTGANRLPDGAFRGSFQIPANELTATEEQSLIVRMYHRFNSIADREFLRGESLRTIVNDTSQLPYLRAVFFSANNSVSNPSIVETINEGDTFYVHVWGNSLASEGQAVTVSLNWEGTATAVDFQQVLPNSIQLNQFNAVDQDYRGVVGPFTARADLADG